MWPFTRQPRGFMLEKADGGIPGKVRGDLIPADTIVIIYGGRLYVKTGTKDWHGFAVYREGHKTFEYRRIWEP